ncbi:MAG: hypothetical protein OXM01_08800 [Gemmatimonadota bacterium]|nr:hypothetical protein [Gemmatimonadota bacterium]
MLLAMLAGYFLSDRPDSSGGRVAAAANRVNEQVNDTRQDFQEIQALALEAQAPTAIMQESMSGGGAPAEATAQQEPEPAPGSLPGIPAGDQTVGSIVAIPGDGQAEGNRGDDKAAPPATLTFNEKARAIQGEAPLTVHQEAAQRLVDSWGPQYDAAVAEHNSLMLRIRETRALWQEYREEQTSLIEEMHNPELRASMAMDLRSDIAAYEEWNINAEQVEVRSSTAMTKLHDMNRAIQFQRNRADFRALIGGESVGMSLQVTLLLESLDTFESRTNALSAAISAG